MNITLPGSPMYDVASTTTATIAPYAGVMALAAGVFVAFFIIEYIIEILAQRYYPKPPEA